MTTSNAVLVPTNVRPSKYRITLEPDFTTFAFTGSETIQVEILSPTTSITLNSIEIAIKSCTITLPDGAELAARSTLLNEEDETARFQFGAELPVGEATLTIEFTGELNDKLRGFYRSSYTDIDGNERYMATTQLEATDARRAFPCWDEPALKATFELTLVVPSEMTAVSNMPVVSEEEIRPGVKSVSYAETPIMSTYLLAFIVGDLSYIEDVGDNGTLMRVFTTRGREGAGSFRVRDFASTTEVLQRLLRHTLSSAQARPLRHS